MPQFFTVSHNSFHKIGFPWISTLQEGFSRTYYCQTCSRSIYYATGEMVGVLERSKGSKWSDVLGCGHYPFLIVSERVVECWIKENVGTFPIKEIKVAKPL